MKIDTKNVRYHHILLYYFLKGKRAADAQRKMCSVHRNDAVTESECQMCFTKFHSGDVPINDEPRSGHLTEIDWSDAKAIVNTNPSQSVREIAIELNISHRSVEKYLRQLEMDSRR